MVGNKASRQLSAEEVIPAMGGAPALEGPFGPSAHRADPVRAGPDLRPVRGISGAEDLFVVSHGYAGGLRGEEAFVEAVEAGAWEQRGGAAQPLTTPGWGSGSGPRGATGQGARR